MSVPSGTPLNYPPGSQPPIKRISVNRAPTSKDGKNFREGDEWLDRSSNDWYKLAKNTPSSVIWARIGGTGGPLESFIPDSGTSPVVPDASNQITITGANGITTSGGANSLTIQPSAAGYPITPYVVGKIAGESGYSTIQDALDAANAAGGGFVFVQNGTYTENLTCYPNITVSAPGISSGYPGTVAAVIIEGNHTPATTGIMTFNNITFITPTGDTFSTTAAGTGELNFSNAGCGVTNGYFVNVPNWTGILSFWDFNPSLGTNDGGINNPTGGASVFCYEAGVGFGLGQTMQLSGTVIYNQGEVFCPIQFNSGTNAQFANCAFGGTWTINDNATVISNNGQQDSAATPSISMNSTGNVTLSECVYTSSNDPIFTGTGSGTLEITGCSFTGNANFAPTLTLSGGTVSTATYSTLDLAEGMSISSNEIVADGTSANIDITMTPKGTGTVNPSALSVNSAYDFPTVDGTVGQVMTTNGSGVASWGTAAGGSSAISLQVFTAPGTYTPTPGMTHCIIECVGGGGGGGGIANTNVGSTGSAGSGGGGEYTKIFATAGDIGPSQLVSVGVLGTPGAITDGLGGDGGPSGVGAIASAFGGTGGAGGAGGAGGTGGSGGIGSFTIQGGNGASGSIGISINIYLTQTSGGCSFFSPKTDGGQVNTTIAGTAALNYGQGGGGGVSFNNQGASLGGTGFSGVVVITEFI